MAGLRLYSSTVTFPTLTPQMLNKVNNNNTLKVYVHTLIYSSVILSAVTGTFIRDELNVNLIIHRLNSVII